MQWWILEFSWSFFTEYYLIDMVNSLIKLKLLKTSMFGAIAGGIAVIAVASVVTKAMCKKKKKISEEKQS